MLFDGKTMTLLGKTLNIYTQLEVPATSDDLIDESETSYKRPLTGSDLLLANAYNDLMHDVVVVIKEPVLEGDNLVYTVEVLDSLGPREGKANALSIDAIGIPEGKVRQEVRQIARRVDRRL
jgi:hypothetical protein